MATSETLRSPGSAGGTADEAAALERVRDLMLLAAGDEKHNPSAYSTFDTLWVLYDQILRYDPAHPRADDRDRFVLSKGHGPLALYAILAEKGFFPADELRRFTRRDSILGAHPDRNKIPGIEASTGSLGHGLPMALGVALALRIQGNDRRVFTLIGDGEANEGSVWESVLLAPNLRLANLTCIVINNHSSANDLGDIAAKFAAFGWEARTVDGRNRAALAEALRATAPDRPTCVVADVRDDMRGEE